MTAPLLARLALPAILEGVRAVLAGISHPAARGAASALDELARQVEKGAITQDEMKEANRHLETLAALDTRERETAIGEINQSLRAEVASNDAYVRRMRPTFGYLIAVTWAAQMLSLAYIIIAETDKAALVIDAMESLGTIWTVGLSVLGIYVYQRSAEKKSGLVRHTPPAPEKQAGQPRLND